ncbi:MAG: vitamin K epoxide reductase family protein [Pseudobdellovibrionaceae bacterium]
METQRQKHIFLALLFTIMGFGVHMYLAIHHYELKFGLSDGAAFCNVNDYASCDAVAASKYSELLGVPMAMLGLVGQGVLALMLVVYAFGWSQLPEHFSRMIYFISAFFAGVSVVMGVISLGILQKFCLMCSVTYVLSFLNMYAVHKGAEDRRFSEFFKDIPEWFTKRYAHLSFIAAIPLIAFIANSAIIKSYAGSSFQLAMSEYVSKWQAGKVLPFDLTKGLIYRKDGQNMKMTIVEFADYRCGHCKKAASPLHAFASSHPDVQLVYKSYPLDGSCNTALKESGGDGISCHLAFLTYCSEKIKQAGWKANSTIYDEQETFARQTKEQSTAAIADALQISVEELKVCTEEKETFDAVQAQALEGTEVRGTPTIYVNGKLLPPTSHFLPLLQEIYKQL